MIRKSGAVALLLAVALWCGCRQRGDSRSSTPIPSASTGPEEAIRAAVRARVAHNSNLNPNAFDTVVKSVTLDGDHAQAEVEFHVKNGPGVMELTYALTKHNGAWSVVESQPLGSNFAHPQLNPAQAAAPNAGASRDSSIFRTMDNFHGGSAAPAPKLPPGHPPIVATRKSGLPQTP